MAYNRTSALNLRPSDRCRKLVKQFEGLRLQSYIDAAGHRTIGYGRLLNPGPVIAISKDQAERYLDADLARIAAGVREAVTVPLAQYEFDALVSFAYNVGVGNLKKSTLLKLLNEGRYDRVPGQFPRWNKAGGRVLKGLVERRRIERAIFSGLPY